MPEPHTLHRRNALSAVAAALACGLLPARVQLAYRLNLDEFQGQQRLQMVVEAAIAAPA